MDHVLSETVGCWGGDGGPRVTDPVSGVTISSGVSYPFPPLVGGKVKGHGGEASRAVRPLSRLRHMTSPGNMQQWSPTARTRPPRP